MRKSKGVALASWAVYLYVLLSDNALNASSFRVALALLAFSVALSSTAWWLIASLHSTVVKHRKDTK